MSAAEPARVRQLAEGEPASLALTRAQLDSLGDITSIIVPTKTTPAISPEEAEKAAVTRLGEPGAQEITLARCELALGLVDPCWVVVLLPAPPRLGILSGPDGKYNETHAPTMATRMVLVDGLTGEANTYVQTSTLPDGTQAPEVVVPSPTD